MADQSFAFTARRVLTAAGPDGSRALADGEPADVLVLNGCRLVRLWQTDAVPGANQTFEPIRTPAVWRREHASETVRAMERNGTETYDIPAFLRRQAD